MSEPIRQWAMKKTCSECPWLKTAMPGRFPPERYEALKETANGSFCGFPQPLFACHKSRDGEELTCAGFLKVVGYDNIAVRLAAMRERVDLSEIEASGPLYGSYKKMAEANGVVMSAEAK